MNEVAKVNNTLGGNPSVVAFISRYINSVNFPYRIARIMTNLLEYVYDIIVYVYDIWYMYIYI